MQFLAARSLWTNLLAFRYDMPSAISPAIWIIFLSGGRTWLVLFCCRVRGDEVRGERAPIEKKKKNTVQSVLVSSFFYAFRSTVVTVQHYKVRDGGCMSRIVTRVTQM